MAPLLESIHAPLQNTCLVIEHTPLTPQILTKGSWPQQKHASLQRTLHPFQSLQGRVLFLLLVLFPRTVLRTRRRYLMAPSWRKKVLLWDPCSSMSLCPFSLRASHESHSLKTWTQGPLSLHPISPIRLPPTEQSDVCARKEGPPTTLTCQVLEFFIPLVNSSLTTTLLTAPYPRQGITKTQHRWKREDGWPSLLGLGSGQPARPASLCSLHRSCAILQINTQCFWEIPKFLREAYKVGWSWQMNHISAQRGAWGTLNVREHDLQPEDTELGVQSTCGTDSAGKIASKWDADEFLKLPKFQSTSAKWRQWALPQGVVDQVRCGRESIQHGVWDTDALKKGQFDGADDGEDGFQTLERSVVLWAPSLTGIPILSLPPMTQLSHLRVSCAFVLKWRAWPLGVEPCVGSAGWTPLHGAAWSKFTDASAVHLEPRADPATDTCFYFRLTGNVQPLMSQNK